MPDAYKRPPLASKVELFLQDYLALRERIGRATSDHERRVIQGSLNVLRRKLHYYRTRSLQLGLNPSIFEQIPSI